MEQIPERESLRGDSVDSSEIKHRMQDYDYRSYSMKISSTYRLNPDLDLMEFAGFFSRVLRSPPTELSPVLDRVSSESGTSAVEVERALDKLASGKTLTQALAFQTGHWVRLFSTRFSEE